MHTVSTHTLSWTSPSQAATLYSLSLFKTHSHIASTRGHGTMILAQFILIFAGLGGCKNLEQAAITTAALNINLMLPQYHCDSIPFRFFDRYALGTSRAGRPSMFGLRLYVVVWIREGDWHIGPLPWQIYQVRGMQHHLMDDYYHSSASIHRDSNSIMWKTLMILRREVGDFLWHYCPTYLISLLLQNHIFKIRMGMRHSVYG